MQVAVDLAGGAARTLAAYPLDTIKVWRQLGEPLQLHPRALYRGVGVPLATNAPVSALLQHCQRALVQLTGSHAVAGALAGIVCTAATAPLDALKVGCQARTRCGGRRRLGWGVTAGREAVSGAAFFCTFNRVRLATGSVVAAGVAAGLASAIASHPLDVLKTRCLAGMSLRAAMARGQLLDGLGVCLARAACMNAVQWMVVARLGGGAPPLQPRRQHHV